MKICAPFRRIHAASSLAAAWMVLRPEAARADMLSGGLLGSVFRGDAFTGPRLIDLVVIGLLLFAVLRLVVGRTKGTGTGQPGQAGPADRQDTPPGEGPPPVEAPQDRPNVYSNAQAAWDRLKSRPAPGEQPAGAATRAVGATPDEQFLAGAKLAYTRILASLAEGDFDDLASFVTPAFLERLKATSRAPLPDILLVEATLAGRSEDGGRAVMTVDYQALVREPEAPHNTDRRERWRFIRDNASPEANWLLDGMDRVS